MSLACSLSAQDNSGASVTEGSLPLVDRFAIKTNAVDWVVTVPNLQLAFDLNPSVYNQEVVLLSLKYNWTTWQNYLPRYVFDLFDIRPEYRWYFRESQRLKLRDKSKAYYMGAYSDFFSFDIKLGKEGRRGQGIGAGLSGGYEVPLYQFEKGAIDLDLGLAAGLGFFWGKSGSFTSYPMIAEVRAAFAWRHTSVKHRYLEPDPEIKLYNDAVAAINNYFAQSTTEEFLSNAGEKMRAKYAKDRELFKTDYLKSLQNAANQLRSVYDEEPSYSPKLRVDIGHYLDKKYAAVEKEFLARLAAEAAQAEGTKPETSTKK